MNDIMIGKKTNWVLACVLLCGGLSVYLLVQAKGFGAFPRAKLEAVVTELRAQSLEPGRVHRFKLDPSLKLSSMHRLKEGEYVHRGQGRGLVWAEVSPDGVLRVAFETRDLGHAGESGVLYSDTPVTSADVAELGREWKLGRRLSEHWWVIIYDLE